MTQTITNQATTSNTLNLIPASPAAFQMPAPPAARRSGLERHLAQRWDLYGILALMASCAGYGVSALAHLV